MIGSWPHSACLTPGKQFKPSETTRLPGRRCFVAHAVIFFLVKPLIWLNRKDMGCPLHVFCEECKNGDSCPKCVSDDVRWNDDEAYINK